jgi:hypothetical protein
VQTVVEIDKRVRRPQPLAELFARDDIPGPFEERDQNVYRPAPQAQPEALFPKFARTGVELEKAKPVYRD